MCGIPDNPNFKTVFANTTILSYLISIYVVLRRKLSFQDFVSVSAFQETEIFFLVPS